MNTPRPPAYGSGGDTTRLDPPQAEPRPQGEGSGSLMEEAQALKLALRDAYGRADRLIASLKRQRKQSKLVQSTLASLKQLQRIDA